jgi:PadR family transcriptional regulator PadR
VSPRRESPQTRLVYRALRASGRSWCHGYDISRVTGLAAGTLYPILARLTERGMLESRWEDEPPTGRPRRHLYRLSAEGEAHALALAAEPLPDVRSTTYRPGLADGRA